MASRLESPSLLKMADPLLEYSSHLEVLFPRLEWDLKRSGFTIESTQYIAVIIYITVCTFTMCVLITVLPVAVSQGIQESYTTLLLSLVVSLVTLIYLIILPALKMKRRAAMIDRDLEFMLKDMQIQLSAGIPLFDTLVNIVRGGYGECSKICEGIVEEVEQGKSMTDVLDDVGMWSPSEYLRRMLWQIVNALKSGGDVSNALEAIANDIRVDKENKIKAYGKELNLYGLIYLMLGIIVPSMGVTLLVILSSFLGKGVVNETLLWMIMAGLIAFQAVFIMFVRSKRPIV